MWDSADPGLVLLVIRCHGDSEMLPVPVAFVRSSHVEVAATIAFVDRPADPDAMRWEDLPGDAVVR